MNDATHTDLIEKLDAAGQSHITAHLGRLDTGEADRLLGDLENVDFKILAGFQDMAGATSSSVAGASIGSLDHVPAPTDAPGRRAWDGAFEKGEAALRRGRVGAFLAAGGQGARLGFSGPKGTYPIGPVTDRTLFQVLLEGWLAGSRRYGKPLPLAIMTSRANDAETRAFLEDHRHFGLCPERVRQFPQRMLPALTEDGKLALKSRDRLFLSPDGHGGALRILLEDGALSWFRSQGVDTLYYFQIDNPLLPVPDPAFIGHHLERGADFTTKVVRKTGPEERMGVFANVDGVMRIVEYIDLPAELARETDDQGRLLFWAGNMAVHAIDLPALETRFGSGLSLPYHVARKPAEVIDPSDPTGPPRSATVCKMETFIFDAIPLMNRPLVVECERGQEFAPVKASEGADTPERARQMMVHRAASWLESAGVDVPRGSGGAPRHPVEISPLTALFKDDLVRADLPDRLDGPLVL